MTAADRPGDGFAGRGDSGRRDDRRGDDRSGEGRFDGGGGSLGGGDSSVIVLFNRAPNPNAAKVFLNWYLSRRGQMTWQKVMNLRVQEPSNSMRIDIPTDDVLPEARRIEGRKYPFVTFLDPKPVEKFYKDLLNTSEPPSK